MDAEETELLSVTVDLWHPSCWTLRVSESTRATLLGTGTAVHGDTATGRYTLSGPDTSALEDAVEAIRASSLTDRVDVLASRRPDGGGSATRSVLVEFDAGPSIRDAFTDRGFVHDGRTRHEDGRERRSFLVRSSRTAVRNDIDAVSEAYDADVDLRRLAPAAGDDDPRNLLSPRQCDAFELARQRGYYAYPRETTATELAGSLGLSKTTYLEHLRKAEAKLLSGFDLD
jgi:predicted DNA binding protein